MKKVADKDGYRAREKRASRITGGYVPDPDEVTGSPVLDGRKLSTAIREGRALKNQK